MSFCSTELSLFQGFFFYLSWESLHQNGHQQVKEDIVAQGHEGNEVEGRPGRGRLHAVIQHRIPVLLCQYLTNQKEAFMYTYHLSIEEPGTVSTIPYCQIKLVRSRIVEKTIDDHWTLTSLKQICVVRS